MKTRYEIGDKCWIAIGPPPLWAGRVVMSFTTTQHAAEYYIIEILHPDYPQFEVRDVLLMADKPEGPLPFMENRYSGAEDDEPIIPLIDAGNTKALMDSLEGVRLDNEHDGIN